jgi:hypothetical protein
VEQLPETRVPQDGMVIAAGTVRGTQSFVHTLSACWRRPSLTALEVLWRWVYGIPVILVLRYEGLRILQETPVDYSALRNMTVLDLMGSAATMAKAMMVLLPPVLRVALWLAPVLVVVWVVVSSVGRTVVMRRVDGRLHARLGTLIVLQAVRVVALLGSFSGLVLGDGVGGGVDCDGTDRRGG